MAHTDHTKEVHPLRVAIVTLSDTRSLEDDISGNVLSGLFEEAGHQVCRRILIRDEPDQLRGVLLDLLREDDVHVIITTGGTGVGRRDITVDTVRPMLDLELEGFGEQFRALSFQEIGGRGLISRAMAGTAGKLVVACLPGSVGAVRMAAEKLLLSMLGHLAWMLQKEAAPARVLQERQETAK